MCIGDRYKIGGAVFEVTQPRVTCYRVGIRMNNPAMPALLVSHRRPGFYFRVIEEGQIGAGDEIVKVADGPEHVTVQEADALLYLPGRKLDQLRRALRVPALSEGWKGSFRALVAAEENGSRSGNAGLLSTAAPSPTWPGFRTLRIAAMQRESVDVLSVVLESEDRIPLPNSLPGQFLVFKLDPDMNSDPILRNYSISGSPGTGRYRISVKRASGAGSRHFHDHLQSGDLLQVSAPRGNFTLAPGNMPVVLLSAGIGATPVLSMLHALAGGAATLTREVWWCYGTRNGAEHPFAMEVRGLLSALPGSHSLVAYSKPGEADRQGTDYNVSGHLTLSLLQQNNVPKEADFYLCGPAGFMDDFSADLKAWGVPDSCIHTEAFGAGSSVTPGITSTRQGPAHPPADSIGAGPKVSFARSGLTVPWDSRYGSLLEFAEACEVPVKWSCRTGVCHMCETGLIDGSVNYSAEPLDRPAEGNILICCSTPRTAVELDL